MKILSLILVLVSGSAMACPTLEGNFSCVQEGQTFTLDITQSEQNGVTIYNVNGDQIPADNQRKSIPDDEYTRGATYVVACDANELVINQDGIMIDNGRDIGTFENEVRITINSSNNLQQDSTTTLDFNGQQQDYVDSLECTRN